MRNTQICQSIRGVSGLKDNRSDAKGILHRAEALLGVTKGQRGGAGCDTGIIIKKKSRTGAAANPSSAEASSG